MAQSYEDIGELVRHALDVVVVTGTEPRQSRLEDEPYWSALAGLIEAHEPLPAAPAGGHRRLDLRP